MSSSYEDPLYEDFRTHFNVLRDFLDQKINQTYHLGYSDVLTAKQTINARVLYHLDLVLGHKYFDEYHNNDLVKLLKRMETLIKNWGKDGGEEKAQRKKLEKMAEKMERANRKGWSSAERTSRGSLSRIWR